MKKFNQAISEVTSEFSGKGLAGIVVDAAISAADPTEAVKANILLSGDSLTIGKRKYTLSSDSEVILVALGKAAPAMITAAKQVLNSRFTKGVCICKHFSDDFQEDPRIKLILGNHPVPGEGSLVAGEAIRAVVTGLKKGDVVVLLLSGGGSALAALPADGIRLGDLQALTGSLLRSGATINEINAVRKHLDLIKGGGLLRMAAPARVAALVLSDVVGSPLDVIASGPAVPDPTTFSQAYAIIQQAGNFGEIPQVILDHFLRGVSGKVAETVKPGDEEAELGENTIIGSNLSSCTAAFEKAQSLGFNSKVITSSLTGEASSSGEYLAQLAINHQFEPRPFVLICGGETTVTIKKNGKGGRNLEVALGAVHKFAGLNELLLITCATDGEDGPTDAAGAVVTGTTLNRATALGLNPLDYLANNNSYVFFEELGDLLITGPTGTNVNDINFIFGF